MKITEHCASGFNFQKIETKESQEKASGFSWKKLEIGDETFPVAR